MPGPIDALRFVHAAILTEAEALDVACGHLSSPAEARALAPRVVFLADVIRKHTAGEEVGLFPYLSQREPHFSETYLLDHEEERAQLDAVSAAAESGDVKGLQRGLAALHDHARVHILKENTFVLPWVADTFTPAEQGKMVQEILSTIPPSDMPRIVPWIVSNNPEQAAVTYVRVLQSNLPAPAFAGIAAAIQKNVPSGRWAVLTQNIEGLSA